MKVYALTIAFCPAAQFARTIIEWRKNPWTKAIRHIVVLGHYPINSTKNNRDIAMLCQSFGLELWDPGVDLGCAQTQTMVMNQLPDYDAFVNVDPDSCCANYWQEDAQCVLEQDDNCAVISCMSPLIKRYAQSLPEYPFEKLQSTQIIGPSGIIHYAIAKTPVPFNLSMWRCDFFRELGGIPQVGERWGETEALVHAHAKMQNKYHGYLLDTMENEDGKYMQDKQLMEYKDLHLRTTLENRFNGVYIEYLRWKYPELVNLDTHIPDATVFS